MTGTLFMTLHAFLSSPSKKKELKKKKGTKKL